MPHISIKMYPGRSEAIKQELAEKTHRFFVDTMQMEAKYISVSIEEIEREQWEQEVTSTIRKKDMYIEADF